MLQNLRTATGGLILAVSVAALAGCGGGGSSSSGPAPQPPTITAHATIPLSVDSNAGFSVPVTLTSSSSKSSTHDVYVKDVGSAAPAISCSGSQSIVTGGPAKSFSCQAPQATLGGNNQHEIQIYVDGKANLSSPVAVDVANGGAVKDELQNTSGTPITSAAPGQTVDVAFSTSSTPAGVGQYTVTPPGGWQVSNGGLCSLPASSGSTCKVAVSVPATAANGQVTIGVSAESGSSQLDTDKLPLSVQAQAPTNDMTFEYQENVTDTLYANLPSQSVTFTYKPTFTFKNTSGGTLGITAATVNGLTNPTYTCGAGGSASSSPSCSLAAGDTYTVRGDLDNTFSAVPGAPTSLSIAIQGSGKTFAQYDLPVTFVKYVPDHVAVRIVNNNGHQVYAAATYKVNGNATMVNFSSTSGIGTVASSSGADFSGDQATLPSGGGVLYLPYGNSGALDIARSGSGFNSKAAPDPTGSPAPPPFVHFEPTYIKLFAQGNGNCKSTDTVCESLTVDQSYIQFISTLATLATIGQSAPYNLPTQGGVYGIDSNKTQARIFAAVESYFDGKGKPWAYDAANGTRNYIQKDAGGNITMILAPIQVHNTAFDPMTSGYYDTYVNALWSSMANSPIYVDADSAVSGNSGCVLKGQVMTGGTNAGKLVFSVQSGTCAAKAQSIDPGYTNNCGSGGNQACADTPDLVFGKFNDCDFIEAAGSQDCHGTVTPKTFFSNEALWGPNGTYRAVVGRAIAAYQAIGLLPNCANPTQVMSKANAVAYVQAQLQSGAGLTSPSCLSGVSKPTYNVYAAALLPYTSVYTYTYGDFLGRDGTITYTYGNIPPASAAAMPRAQPITLTLR